MERKATFDLKGLLDWGLNHAIQKAEEKTALEGLGDLVKPLANSIFSSIGVQAIEIDPIIFAMGRVVYSGIQRQAAIAQAKKEALNVNNGNSSN